MNNKLSLIIVVKDINVNHKYYRLYNPSLLYNSNGDIVGITGDNGYIKFKPYTPAKYIKILQTSMFDMYAKNIDRTDYIISIIKFIKNEDILDISDNIELSYSTISSTNLSDLA